MSARRALGACAVGLLLPIVLGACGSEEEKPREAAGAPPSAGRDDVPEEWQAPEECAEAWPWAFGEPDLSEVEMLPPDWPPAPEGSTLCLTTGTVGESQESADYATDLSPADLLTTYERSLPASYRVTREPGGAGGEVLNGQAGEVAFHIKARDGAFSLVFSR